MRYRFSGAPVRQEDRFENPLGFQVVRYRRDQEALVPAEPQSRPGTPPAQVQPAPAQQPPAAVQQQQRAPAQQPPTPPPQPEVEL
jgi:type IV secretion system protein VirB8